MKYARQHQEHEAARNRHKEIRDFAAENQDLSQVDIALHFEISLTTVSKAMNAPRCGNCDNDRNGKEKACEAIRETSEDLCDNWKKRKEAKR